jgi:hypothetical protein
MNNKPEDPFAPPYLNLDGDFSGLTDAGALMESAIQSQKTGNVAITINDASLHDEMWVTFYFYDAEIAKWSSEGVVGQVFQKGAMPGTYEVVFTYGELSDAGLEPGSTYFIHYSNEMGDIFGYGTPTKGALEFDNPCISVTPSAAVKKLSGNTNMLTITVTELYAGGEIGKFGAEISINNNSDGTFAVGPYKVYVDTKGNDQIRACYLVN